MCYHAHGMKSVLTERRLIHRIVSARAVAAAILALYLLVGLTHSVVNPIFESSDEWSHYPFVEHVARGQGLPVQRPGEETLWRHEGSQPPLYYLVMGAITSWIDTSDLPKIMAPNPHARIGVPLATDNKNMIIHTAAEDWPWRGAVLAVHLVRIASVLMGAVTVLFTYLIARELAPGERWVAHLAMALHAFLPMFAFISASVNNDNITYMLSAIGLFLILRTSRRLPAARDLLWVGIVLGLAALSKLSGLMLLPMAALGLLVAHLRHVRESGQLGRTRPVSRGASRAVRFLLLPWLRDLAVIVIPVVLIAGWWYVRNIALYGDPTGLKVLNTFIHGRGNTPWYKLLMGEWESFRINFWGLFGGVNVLMKPRWIYHVLDGITLAAVLGLVAWAGGQLRRRARSLDCSHGSNHPHGSNQPHGSDQPHGGEGTRWIELGLAVVYIVLLTIGVARYTLSTPATQGRLIFPGLAAIMTLFSLGLVGWLRPRWRPVVGVPVAGLLFALSLSSPFTAIRAAYAPPETMAASDLPQAAKNFEATFSDAGSDGAAPGGAIELLGYDFGTTRLHPGEQLPVKLYWQALKPTAENYSLYIKVFGRADELLGQIDVYPGRGTLPTSMWQPGRIVVDTFYVPIKKAPSAPVAATVRAGLYRLETMQNLEVRDPKGHVVETPVLGQVKVYGPEAAEAPQTPLNVQFGQLARLVGFDLEGAPQPAGVIALNLHWQVTGTTDKDYTVFVHLLDAAGNTVANNDGPPLEATYPTSYWEPGEHLLDRHALALPESLEPGTYRALVGLYEPDGGARVPVLDSAGKQIGDAAQEIEIAVSPP